MPNVTEDELRALLVAERARNAKATTQTPARGLPELKPGMLLSAAGAQEVQAAQHMLQLPTRIEPIAAPPTPGLVRALQRTQRPVRVAEVGDEVLANLWNHTVPAGALALAAEHTAFAREYMAEWQEPPNQVVSENDIQFDNSGLDADLAAHVGAPRSRARFRVDRESPPPRPPIARLASPIDGRVVAARQPDGRFQTVRPAPRSAVSAASAASRELDALSSRRESAARLMKPVTTPEPPPARRVSSWERLGNDDFD